MPYEEERPRGPISEPSSREGGKESFLATEVQYSKISVLVNGLRCLAAMPLKRDLIQRASFLGLNKEILFTTDRVCPLVQKLRKRFLPAKKSYILALQGGTFCNVGSDPDG